MKIEKVVVKGIKSHSYTTFHPEDYTVIVGENNTGKSNIFFALRWFFKDVKLSNRDVLFGYDANPEVEITFKMEDDETIPDKIDEDYIQDRKFIIRASVERESVRTKDSAPNYQQLCEGKEPVDMKKYNPGDIIYIPSIRELNDEFKFTANSSITILVSRFLIQRIKDEDGKSRKFSNIKDAIEDLSNYIGKGENSALEELKKTLNKHMLEYKDVNVEFKLDPPNVDDFIKSSFKPEIKTTKGRLDLNSQGMGFQRSLIFSLICSVSEIDDSKSGFILYLVEEPELFLHPNHQNSFKNHLRTISEKGDNQVLVTTHSPFFINNIRNYSELKRVGILEQVSCLNEITHEDIQSICTENGKLMAKAKNEARTTKWTKDELKDEEKRIAKDDEIRYLLWVNPERATAFLSKKVILVEGPTEKALVSYLRDEIASNNGSDLLTSVSVVDTVGKFHIYKFSNLFRKLGSDVWVIYDNDNNKVKGISHEILNSVVTDLKSSGVIKDCFEINPCLEEAMGLEKDRYNPDTSLYRSLTENEKGCRDSKCYTEIRQFIEGIMEVRHA